MPARPAAPASKRPGRVVDPVAAPVADPVPASDPGPVAAADNAVGQNVTKVRLPLMGDVSLPPVDHLVWYSAVAVLTAVELVEWPIALVLAAGKLLADNRSHRTLRAFGEALEQVE